MPGGIDIEVPVHCSVLDALEDAGVDVMYDCLRGEYGLCRLKIVSVDGLIDPLRRVPVRTSTSRKYRNVHLRLSNRRKLDHSHGLNPAIFSNLRWLNHTDIG